VGQEGPPEPEKTDFSVPVMPPGSTSLRSEVQGRCFYGACFASMTAWALIAFICVRRFMPPAVCSSWGLGGEMLVFNKSVFICVYLWRVICLGVKE
jgi:hypothetical protein